ncbi:Ephrin type-A receptor 2 [Exaiptasia diaphana]|nr:Ephrin type-A receptor 2 [Exaiptasia diaphana]
MYTENQPNSWLITDAIKIKKVRRIDVTVEFAIWSCSGKEMRDVKYCKESFDIYVHLASEMYTTGKIPNPYLNHGAYDLKSAVSPKYMVMGFAYEDMRNIRSLTNVETYPIDLRQEYPYVYIAFRYTGGCISMSRVIAHYYQCPAKTLSESLIRVPMTMSPPCGSQGVRGQCFPYAQPESYGNEPFWFCEAEGKWSNNSKGMCICKAGYDKVNTSKREAECQEKAQDTEPATTGLPDARNSGKKNSPGKENKNSLTKKNISRV